jgi:glycosyltransferase involved in cell wall biosynthesis
VRILRLLMEATETSGPYNLLTLPALKIHQIHVHSLLQNSLNDIPSELKISSSRGSISAFLSALRKLLASNQRPDIIHAHTPHVGFLYTLIRFYTRSDIPYILTLHCSYENLTIRNRFLFWTASLGADTIVPCSNSSDSSLPPLYRFFLKKRIHAIQNGVDTQRIQPYFEARKASDELRIIWIGRLIKLKRPMDLLCAFRQIRAKNINARLTIIGEGHLKDDLEEYCQTHQLENWVRLTGNIPRNHVYRELSMSDLFVSTSSREGLPIAVLEAMTMGIVPILSDIPPHREILGSNWEREILYPTGDTHMLESKVLSFAGYTDHDREKMSAWSRENTIERFGLERMLREYNELFDSLISVKSGK